MKSSFHSWKGKTWPVQNSESFPCSLKKTKSSGKKTLRGFFCRWGKDLLTFSQRKLKLRSARVPSSPCRRWQLISVLGFGTLKSGDGLQNYEVLKFLTSCLSPRFRVLKGRIPKLFQLSLATFSARSRAFFLLTTEVSNWAMSAEILGNEANLLGAVGLSLVHLEISDPAGCYWAATRASPSCRSSTCDFSHADVTSTAP